MNIYEYLKNPFNLSEEEKSMVKKIVVETLENGPLFWFNKKEKTPVSLEIPPVMTNIITVLCKEKEVVQWDFETKLFTKLVFDGIMLNFLLRNSEVLKAKLEEEADQKLEEYGLI